MKKSGSFKAIKQAFGLGFLLLTCVCAAYAEVNDDAPAKRATAMLDDALKQQAGSPADLTAIITGGQWDAYQAMVRKYEDERKANLALEVSYSGLFQLIREQDPHLEDNLNQWVKASPSYISYGLRGVYWQKRGILAQTRVDDTQPKRAKDSNARKFYVKAKSDLQQAVSLNKQFTPGYAALISLDRILGSQADGKKRYSEAIANNPDSYIVRLAWMKTLSPNGGGSYSEMQTATATFDSSKNPMLWALKGIEASERGLDALANGDNQGAIIHFTKALQFGVRNEVLYARGTASMRLKKYQDAMADFQQCYSRNRFDLDCKAFKKEMNATLYQQGQVESYIDD